MDLRKRGARNTTLPRKKERPSPLSAIDSGSPGEVRISNNVLMALQQLYQTSPSIQAARTILLGQLLSSGVVVRREGKDVKLKPTFQAHINDVWLPFARDVIDSFLVHGFAVVSLEEEPAPAFTNFRNGRRAASNVAATTHMAPVDTERARGRPPDASGARRAQSRRPEDQDKKRDLAVDRKNINLIPVVPDLGQYELSFWHVGSFGYQREYRIFATNSDNVYRQDHVSEVFFKSAPDACGNVCSPVATVFQSASFISALEELALQAEVVRTRQLLVTQPTVKTNTNANLDPANLFFDSESRAIQASATAEDDANQASSLATQAKLMALLNRLQTTNRTDGNAATPAPASHVPPALPPSLFACPDRQTVVPGVRPPEARSDLVDLMRCCNDHIAAAMGVSRSDPTLYNRWHAPLRDNASHCAGRSPPPSSSKVCHPYPYPHTPRT